MIAEPRIPPSFILSLVVLIAATASSQAVEQTETRTISAFRALTRTQGYAVQDGKLYWTFDNARSWVRSNPPDPAEEIVGVSFPSGTKGYVVTGILDPDNEPPKRFHFYSIDSKGGTWKRISNLAVDPHKGLSVGTASMFFLNENTGWIGLRYQSSSAFSFGALFSTKDGGLTWTSLPEPPVLGEMTFATPTAGYMVDNRGGPEMYRTSNGGVTWVGFTPFRPPLAETTQVQYSRIHFQGEQHGYLLAEISEYCTSGSYSEILRTMDAGVTWFLSSHPLPSLGNLRPAEALDSIPPIQVYFEPKLGLVTSLSASTKNVTPIPNSDHPHPWVEGASFLNKQHGWIIIHDGGCRTFKADCFQLDSILVTDDGGMTYREAAVISK